MEKRIDLEEILMVEQILMEEEAKLSAFVKEVFGKGR